MCAFSSFNRDPLKLSVSRFQGDKNCNILRSFPFKVVISGLHIIDQDAEQTAALLLDHVLGVVREDELLVEAILGIIAGRFLLLTHGE